MSAPINVDFVSFSYPNINMPTSGCLSYTTGIPVVTEKHHTIHYTAQCVNCNKFSRDDKLYTRWFIFENIQCPHCGAEG